MPTSFLAPLPGKDSKSILGSCAKKCQQAFLAPLPGKDSKSILGSCAKKCQQAFLAPLPGKALVKRI
jgi:hypothetical protein